MQSLLHTLDHTVCTCRCIRTQMLTALAYCSQHTVGAATLGAHTSQKACKAGEAHPLSFSPHNTGSTQGQLGPPHISAYVYITPHCNLRNQAKHLAQDDKQRTRRELFTARQCVHAALVLTSLLGKAHAVATAHHGESVTWHGSIRNSCRPTANPMSVVTVDSHTQGSGPSFRGFGDP